MARVFASLDDYRTYTGDQSATLTPLQLRSAAMLVARATRHAVYAVKGDGTAVSSTVEAALRDATCEVLRHRDEAGVSSDVTLADLGLQSASIGTASYAVAAAGGGGRAYRALPFDAHMILDGAGLLTGSVVVVG